MPIPKFECNSPDCIYYSFKRIEYCSRDTVIIKNGKCMGYMGYESRARANTNKQMKFDFDNKGPKQLSLEKILL